MTVIEKSVVVQEAILVKASPEEVWRVFSRIEDWPRWGQACRGARHLSGSPWRRGSTFEMVVRPGWRKLTFRCTIVDSQPPERVVWLGKVAGIYGQHTFTFQAEGDGTRITSHEVFSGPMLWALGWVAPPGRVKRMFARWLEALKVEVEKAATPSSAP